MNHIRLSGAGCFLWVLILASLTAAARADSVAADVSTGFQLTRINPARGSNTFFAYSTQTGVGTNVDTAFSRFPSGGLDPESPIPLATAPGGGNVNINVSHGLFGLGGTTSYGPSVAKGPVAKVSVLTTRLLLRSTSGNFSGKAGQEAGNGFVPPNIFANGDNGLSGKTNGSAAAIAFDPFEFIAADASAFDPQLTATLQFTTDSGGVSFFALDTSVYADIANFVESGSPYASTLWSLTIANRGPTIGSSSLAIDFKLNPLALMEIGFSTAYLLGLSPDALSLPASQLSPLIEQEVESRLAGAFSFDTPGIASIDDFSLFPQLTTYTPLRSDIQYANGVIADIRAVPVPSAGFMFGLGLVGLVAKADWLRRRCVSGSIG